MTTKALEIMRNVPSVNDRAEKFFDTIKRNLQKKVIDVLIDKKEELEDKLIGLMDFSLHTDINHGLTPVTREDCEKKFKDAIDLEYQLKLLTLELEAKKEAFNKYFGENDKV